LIEEHVLWIEERLLGIGAAVSAPTAELHDA
jgi:hypothetical protein